MLLFRILRARVSRRDKSRLYKALALNFIRFWKTVCMINIIQLTPVNEKPAFFNLDTIISIRDASEEGKDITAIRFVGDLNETLFKLKLDRFLELKTNRMERLADIPD